MADVLTADFEGATPFAAFTTVDANVTQDSTHVFAGAAAMLSDATTGQANVTKTLTSASLYVVSFQIYIPSTFPDAAGAAFGRFSAPGFSSSWHKKAGVKQFGILFSTGESAYVTYTPNTWIRFVARCSVADPFTVDWNFGGVEQSQVLFDATSGNNWNNFELGWQSGGVANMLSWVDDLKIGNASGDYDTYKGGATVTGAVAFPITIGVDTIGDSFVSGSASLATTFGATTSATQNFFASTSFAETFGVVTTGTRGRFGASASPYTFGATTAGAAVHILTGAAALPITFGVGTAANAILFGAADAAHMLTITTAGTNPATDLTPLRDDSATLTPIVDDSATLTPV